MSYYALFNTQQGHHFRFDTRIYLCGTPTKSQGVCVGAVVGKNPGSAHATTIGQWGPLNVGRDQLLPYVRSVFRQAYKMAGKSSPPCAYVRVWNLFYLCNKNLKGALRSLCTFNPVPACPTETYQEIPFVWFVWGGNEPKLKSFKQRFLSTPPSKAFFYDHKQQTVIPRCPTLTEHARHTLGLVSAPIVAHLATLV